MDEQFDFRALLLKLQDCLSENDRRRLHFLVGDLIPRQIRDDPTLGGTLHLLESLFDKGKINTQDYGYLIHAFDEIGCRAAVQRLKEHQRSQHEPEQLGTFLEDFIDDTEDKIQHINLHNLTLLNEPKPTINGSTSSKPQNRRDRSAQSENEEENTHQPNRRQSSFISRLTLYQIILFILILIGIISFFVITMVVKKRNIPCGEILLTRVGPFHGDARGGIPFDDAHDSQLTFNDRLIKIIGGGTSQAINYVTFIYSNKRSKQRGEKPDVKKTHTNPYEFSIKGNEYIDRVTVYTGRIVIPEYPNPNGTALVVGLLFHTNQGRASKLFGSDDGISKNESFLNYRLGYVRGRAQGYIDGIQFIWYKEVARTYTAFLPAY